MQKDWEFLGLKEYNKLMIKAQSLINYLLNLEIAKDQRENIDR